MNDQELLQRIIEQIGKAPREVGYDDAGNIVLIDLADLGISQIPDQIFELIHLRELHLGNSRMYWDDPLPEDTNSIAFVSNDIVHCKELDRIFLSNNAFVDFPLSLCLLPNLKMLCLHGNQLTSLPAEIALLHELVELCLFNNRLSAIPPEIGLLANLRQVRLGRNHLSQVPTEVGSLSKLNSLDLSYNHLFDVPRSFAALSELRDLDLSGNPLRTPPQEISVLGTTAVRTYLSSLDDTSVIRREGKLLLVGEGRTGKSSLLHALQDLHFNDAINSTHGIDILDLPFVYPEQSETELTLHVWDFGGQHIYHTTHQFFMTTRSLYLLVWNAGTDTDQGRLDHWLRNIQVLAPDARVILVATHIDQRPADFNLDRFRDAYPAMIAGFAGVSNKTGAGIDDLKTMIAEEAARLPLMEQEWPRAWVDVEEALLALDQTYIDGRTFADICARHEVTEAYEQQILGGYLHDLGKILYFQDDDVLSDFIVLKPNWLTQATARVLDDAVTGDDRHGVLEHADFPRIWAGYERRLYPVFLRMLEKFLISYELEEGEPGRRQSLVPLLLPHRPPADLPKWETVLPGQPEVRMVFDLDFVPPGIMSWFIVLTHHYSQDVHWREGVRLHYEGHQADVVLNPSTRQLWLQVRGPAPSNFFTILQHTVNDRIIRKYFEGLTYRRRVPCLCHKTRGEATPCPHYFEYDKLVERKQRGKETIECGESYDPVSVTELLEGIHYSTHDRLEQKLDDMRAVVDANHVLLVENRQLTEQLVRESLRMWNFTTRNAFSDAPSLFVLMPGERRRFDPRNLISEDNRLYLLCQHPAAPHIVVGEPGYAAPHDRDWWRQVSPWLRTMAKLLKFVPKLAGVAEAYDETWYKTIELNVELYSVVAQVVPDFDETLDRLARHALAGDLEAGSIEAEGAALRALHVWLREVDKTQHWCDLQKVVTNDGNVLWLCPEHAKFHGI